MGEGADKELCLLQTVIHIVVGCKDKQSGQMAIGRIILVNIINGGCFIDAHQTGIGTALSEDIEMGRGLSGIENISVNRPGVDALTVKIMPVSKKHH